MSPPVFSPHHAQLRTGAQEKALSSEPMTREVQEQRRSPGSASAGGVARVEWLAGERQGVEVGAALGSRRQRCCGGAEELG
jgi:hypothetical protein